MNIKDNQTGEAINPIELEQRVSETASLIFYLIQRGDQVQLHSEDFESLYDNSQNHLSSLMNYLATVGLDPNKTKRKPALK